MRKLILTLAAVFTLSVAMAQAPQEGGFQPKPSNENKAELAQKRTDKMVKKYGLNEKQAKKLLELNTEYQGKLGFGKNQRQGKKQPMMCEGPRCGMATGMMNQMMPHKDQFGMNNRNEGNMPPMPMPPMGGPNNQMGPGNGMGPNGMMDNSFHIANDTILKELVKKLPGAAIDKDGSITINGKKIKSIVVEGNKIYHNEGVDSTHKGKFKSGEMGFGQEHKLAPGKTTEQMKERKEAKKEYESKLKSIMTKKQYAQYTANKHKGKKMPADNNKQRE